MEYIKFESHLPLRSNYLNDLFNYLKDATQFRFTKTMASAGVVKGIDNELAISYNGGSTFSIKKGVAFDYQHNRIEVSNEITYNLNSFNLTSGQTYYIVIYYNEEIDNFKFDWEDGNNTGNPNNKIYPYKKESYLVNLVKEGDPFDAKYIKLAKGVVIGSPGNFVFGSLDPSVKDFYSINVWGKVENDLISFQDHLNSKGHGTQTPNNPHGLTVDDIQGLSNLFNQIVRTNCLILPDPTTTSSGLSFNFYSDTNPVNNKFEISLLNENEYLILNRIVYGKDDFPTSDSSSLTFYTNNLPSNGTYYIIAYKDNTNSKIKIEITSSFDSDTQFAIVRFSLKNGQIDPFSILDMRRIGFFDAETANPVYNAGNIFGVNTFEGSRNYNMFYVKATTNLNVGNLTNYSFNLNGDLVYRTNSEFEYGLFYKVFKNCSSINDSGNLFTWGMSTDIGSTTTVYLDNKSWTKESETVNSNWKIVLSGYISANEFANLQIKVIGDVRIFIDDSLVLDVSTSSQQTFIISLKSWADGNLHKFETYHYAVSSSSEHFEISGIVQWSFKTEKLYTIPLTSQSISTFSLLRILNTNLNLNNVYVRLSEDQNQLDFYTYNFLEIVSIPSGFSMPLGVYVNDGLLKRVEVKGAGIIGYQGSSGEISYQNDFYYQSFIYDSNNKLIQVVTYLKDRKVITNLTYDSLSPTFVEKISEQVISL